MTKLPAQFVEDKALRDSARDVLVADIAHAKSSLSAKGVATRVGSRIGDGAKDVVEVARLQADDKRGVLAVLIGSIVLWIAREPIFELLGFGPGSEELDGSSQLAESEGEETEWEAAPISDVISGDNDE